MGFSAAAVAKIRQIVKTVAKFKIGWKRSGTVVSLANSGDTVGIGTSDPVSHLEVASADSVVSLTVRSDSANDAALDLIEETGGDSAGFGTANAYGFRTVYDGGANKLFIKSGQTTTVATRVAIQRTDGAVGIGTESPIAELDVAGKIAITAESSTPAQPSDGDGYLYSKSDGKIYWRSYDLSETDLTATGGGGGTDVGWTGPSSGVISTTGSIGVGTTNPGARIEVEVADSENTAGVLIDFDETGGYNALKIDTESTTYFGASVYGKYGVRIEQDLSSGQALYVTRNVVEAGSYALAYFHDDSTSNTQTTLQVRQDGSGDILNLFDGTVEKVTVTGDGKIGVGVTDPEGLVNIKNISIDPLVDVGDPAEYHLHIQGSSTTGKAAGIAFGNSAGNVGSAIVYKDTGGYAQGELQFYTKTSTSTGVDPVQRMVITHDGNVGIGTATPKVPLDLYEMGGLSVAMTHLMPVADTNYTNTTSYVVPTSDWKITFTAPANGKIEIMFSALIAMAASSDDYIFLGLSDNSTYNTLGAQYERHAYQASTGDNTIIEYSWLVTGLTAGTSYTYYIGSKYSGGGPAPAWYWGGTSADEYPPILIKALTVPDTIYAG